ncbi:MAG: acetyl-CoA carboxylase biotin carboxylase subunit [Chitinophagaceae bacterium]|nr:acetyl-CoA carboxylase biotin carboxylase subunit [Chitinophagaceae bacterium]
MFKKVLIANRGEIALRVIRTCREMGIKTVAVYSTADRDSLHVKFADEAVCIGGPKSTESYLNIPNLMAAAEITNADAIHPGYGFLAENAKFSHICDEHGIKFIGPTPDMITAMGDKVTAKETMIRAGVPVIPGSHEILHTDEDAINVAKEVGYPVMLKATAGGGKGMRVVREESAMIDAYHAAKIEAAAAFHNDGIYMEKFVEDPHHIEFQVAGDQFGNVCHLSERDCSIQRRHQKLVEEAPSPFLYDELRIKMGEAAKRAAAAINYESVGTIEFLVDKNHDFYFMEMNTRIQVEHPVTEEVINFDLIKEQIKIAAGERISGQDYIPQMYSIECRINAEDPYNDFRPSPGKITVLHTPGGHGVRVDSHAYAGYVIPPYYDSLIGKLIATARTRSEAIDTMYRALSEYVIEGVATTIPFHLQLMQDERFRNGTFNTKFMENFRMK